MCFLIICTIHHHVSGTQETFGEHCNIHCLGLLKSYVPSPLAGLCPTCLHCSEENLMFLSG